MSLETLTQEEKNSRLLAACSTKEEQEIELLLQAKADANTRSSGSNMALLHYAIDYEHIRHVDLLLQYGADVNAKIWGITPLYNAVTKNNASVTELLLKHGANVDELGQYSLTSLLHAVKNGNTERLCSEGYKFGLI